MKIGEWPCPQCRKPASIIATKCPSCTTIWSTAEIKARQKEFWICTALATVAFAGLVYWIIT